MGKSRRRAVVLGIVLVFCLQSAIISAAEAGKGKEKWVFAVSGDSRNCGNVVMPAIAAGAKRDGALFYWHLGDFRWIAEPDQDYLAEHRHGVFPSRVRYLFDAWNDFISHQLKPFSPLPVYLAPGNHETIFPKRHADYVKKFGKTYLDQPTIREQRLKDDPTANAPRSYYHWLRDGIDFISLDNSDDYAFDDVQLRWVLNIIRRDERNPAVKTIVVGMHEALPDSLSAGHSMCTTKKGITSGRALYQALVHAQENSHKHVYVLASHSHFYLENIYNTLYWRDPKNGGVVLPGWVIGTAGAHRYKLPPDIPFGTDSAEHTYGYLTGTVDQNGKIDFKFHSLNKDDLRINRSSEYDDAIIDWCYDTNPPKNEMKGHDGRDPCGETVGDETRK